MARYAAFLLCLTAIGVAGCSNHPEQAARSASPTAPTTLAATAERFSGPMVMSGPLDVFFPGRNEALDFRQQLETKYQVGLRRAGSSTTVDLEGEVVWTEEYFRYRINGCDHATAVQRVFAQIDGAAAGPICAAAGDGVVPFPPREQGLDFRRQLEAKYLTLRRSLTTTAVDNEGAVVWIEEYIRYRTNACEHPASVLNVFTQIDGNPAPSTCNAPPPGACVYHVFVPIQNVPATGGSYTAELIRDSGSCTWTATSGASAVSLTGETTGGDRGLQTYTVAANTGSPRSMFVTFGYTGGSTRLEVNQAASQFNLSFQLFDYSQSVNATTECQIRTLNSTCTLSSATNALPEAIATYDWRVDYVYGGQKTKTQVSASSTFAFVDACSPSDSGGTPIDMTVRLTVTDTAGNTTTVYSGQGFQPALRLRSFTCP